MSPSFKPFSLRLLNALPAQPLDFALYTPHGGQIEPFFEAHPDFAAALQMDRSLLEPICRMEADAFSPQVAQEAAEILAEQGYAVGLMAIQLPREIIDMNRTRAYALKPWFDFARHPELLERHNLYFDLSLEARNQLLNQLKPEGKWIDVHSMRPFGTPMDSQFPPNGGESQAQWYAQRIQALKNPDFSQAIRTHCLVAHYKQDPQDEGELFVDPALLKALESEFESHGIPFNVSKSYYFTAQIAGKTPPPHYRNGLCVDLLKSALCAEPWGPGFDLEFLTPDEGKVAFYGQRLAQALVKAAKPALVAA